MDLLQGWKTNLGLVVSVLGLLGVATWFGGTDELTRFLDSLVVVIGGVVIIWGRIAAWLRTRK